MREQESGCRGLERYRLLVSGMSWRLKSMFSRIAFSRLSLAEVMPAQPPRG
jgi:hypothetical protein